jgi:hypothetical protein
MSPLQRDGRDLRDPYGALARYKAAAARRRALTVLIPHRVSNGPERGICWDRQPSGGFSSGQGLGGRVGRHPRIDVWRNLGFQKTVLIPSLERQNESGPTPVENWDGAVHSCPRSQEIGGSGDYLGRLSWRPLSYSDLTRHHSAPSGNGTASAARGFAKSGQIEFRNL